MEPNWLVYFGFLPWFICVTVHQVNQGALDDLLDTRQYTTEMVFFCIFFSIYFLRHFFIISLPGSQWNGHQVLERKDISGLTEVPGVTKMTRVLFRCPSSWLQLRLHDYCDGDFDHININWYCWVSILNAMRRDLKKMTDVSNVERLTEVSQAEVGFTCY